MAKQPAVKKWADELDRLLQKAAAALQSADVARIAGVQRELRLFKEQSPDYADALDVQATLAIYDLDLSVAEEAVANIKDRAAEVYRLSKLIGGISEEANANASLLGGTLVRGAIESANSAVASFKTLRDELAGGKAGEQAIAREIDKVLGSIQTLRNKLEKA